MNKNLIQLVIKIIDFVLNGVQNRDDVYSKDYTGEEHLAKNIPKKQV